MLLTDLHVHSTFSDGKMTIAELVDFYGQRTAEHLPNFTKQRSNAADRPFEATSHYILI